MVVFIEFANYANSRLTYIKVIVKKANGYFFDSTVLVLESVEILQSENYFFLNR